MITIDTEACVGCAYCKLSCPNGAIEVLDATARVTEGCTECGHCMGMCPVGAIQVSDAPTPVS